MKHKLLNYIVCPVEGFPLKLERNGEVVKGEVVEGVLSCKAGHKFPIRGGVPRLLLPEALESTMQQTQESFSAKWKRIPDFGFEESSRDFYVNWYLQKYGFGDMKNLKSFLKNKKHILDAGTGLGRDAMLYAKNTRGQVFALDISSSIENAYHHVGHLPNVHLIQADLTALPFPDSLFDYIASDMVIHHTPNTQKSFESLYRCLLFGGEIAFYVYKKKGPIREFCDDFLRNHYTQASEEECYTFSRAMARLGKQLSNLNINIEITEEIPILNIKAGQYDLQRFIYWNIFKCYWNDGLEFDANVMTNFDWYSPKYAHRHTPEEVRKWCEKLGLKNIFFDVSDSGISTRCIKHEIK
jgi:ubiquinone/menaquinone biosynthesis C-methylase UbiE